MRLAQGEGTATNIPVRALRCLHCIFLISGKKLALTGIGLIRMMTEHISSRLRKRGGQVRTIKVFLMASVAAPLMVAPALASETLTYSYDALGRLTTVAHSGTVNSGQQAAYAIDLADNRTGVTVTGAASPVVVVPLNGFTVIPLGLH